jgi:hypothetical protein
MDPLLLDQRSSTRGQEGGQKMARIENNVPNWLDKICAWPVLWYRKRRFGDAFRRIYLGEGKFTLVSPSDFYLFNNFQWCAKEYRGCFHAVRFNNHGDKGPMILSMHRLIMTPPRGLIVDHRNRNGLDNRRSNLRLATYSQNNCNKPKRKNTSSRFVGVSFDKRGQHWVAYIHHNGKHIWLGRFDNEIDAAKARDKAARQYHGEFARLNFP